MWLVKKPEQAGGYLCRTEEALNVCLEALGDTVDQYEITETNESILPDPMES